MIWLCNSDNTKGAAFTLLSINFFPQKFINVPQTMKERNVWDFSFVFAYLIFTSYASYKRFIFFHFMFSYFFKSINIHTKIHQNFFVSAILWPIRIDIHQNEWWRRVSFSTFFCLVELNFMFAVDLLSSWLFKEKFFVELRWKAYFLLIFFLTLNIRISLHFYG